MHTQKLSKNGLASLNVHSFDSISDYGEYVKSLEAGFIKGYQAGDSSSTNRRNWCDDTLTEAIERACNGGYWPEGAEALQSVDLSGTLGELMPVIEQSIDFGMTGGVVDTGEYLANSPECFLQLTDMEEARPIVKIAYMACPASTVSANQVLNRGRAMMALIDGLEKRGFSVQLDIVDLYAYEQTEACEFRIAVKQAGEPWSAGTVAYALANVGFSRRLGFRACEGDEFYTASQQSYASGSLLKKWEAKTIEENEYDLAFGYMIDGSDEGRSCKTPEGALRYMVKQITTQAPQLEAA